MLDAIMKVFARDGYEMAGTDEMVKEAGISKGLLFHYFDSKLGAYEFAYDYVVRYLLLEFDLVVSETEKDPFVLALQAQQVALNVMRSFPHAQVFLYRCREETCEEALAAIRDMRDKLSLRQSRLREQASFEKYPLADREKIWKLMDMTVRSLLEEHLKKVEFSEDEFLLELKQYFAILQRGTIV